MKPLHDTDPRQVGRYRILGRLGAGGMGQVYLGQSPGNRMVAVKTVHREFAAQSEFRERFAREVTAVRRVSGAFTAPVLDADPDAEVPWLAITYISGPTLGEAVQRHGPLPESTLVVLAAGLAEALVDIHGCGIVHRDLKPANVLLSEDGPRVLDFGIARAADGAALTSTGTSVGTPGYWSPEQVEGKDLSPASDIFSLGALLAFAATGRPAFGTGNALTLMRRVCDGEPDLTGLPAVLAPLVTASLAKDAARRPPLDPFLDLPDDQAPGTHWLPTPVRAMITESRPEAVAAPPPAGARVPGPPPPGEDRPGTGPTAAARPSPGTDGSGPGTREAPDPVAAATAAAPQGAGRWRWPSPRQWTAAVDVLRVVWPWPTASIAGGSAAAAALVLRVPTDGMAAVPGALATGVFFLTLVGGAFMLFGAAHDGLARRFAGPHPWLLAAWPALLGGAAIALVSLPTGLFAALGTGFGWGTLLWLLLGGLGMLVGRRSG